jgi:hypothetical protein
MISKEVEGCNPEPWISRKLFLKDPHPNMLGSLSSEGRILDWSEMYFLDPEQFYLRGSTIIIKYSWFAIVPFERVREKLKLITTKEEQLPRYWSSLKTGLLHGETWKRWLGIDSYLVSTSINKKSDSAVSNVEHLRFSVQSGATPVRP